MRRPHRPVPRKPRPQRAIRAAVGRVPWRDDRGQITAFVVVLMVALMGFGGLILDGGLALAAKIEALGQAQEAARAGAQAVDLATYRETGAVRLDPDQARHLAQDYLNAADATGTVTATEETVTVTVTAHQPTYLLDFVTELTVTASGSAEPEPGLAPAP